MDHIAGVGNYAAGLAASDSFSVYDMTFRTLSIGALIDAKRAAGRPRDKLLLPTLDALRMLQKSNSKKDQ
jgi:hypothetical protein